MTIQTPSREHVDADADGQRAFGRALAVLRARAGLTQAQAAASFGTTPQGWGKYEAGKAPTIFRPTVQRRLAGALGLSLKDLQDELAKQHPRPADEDWVEGGRFLEAPEAV